MGFDPGSRSTRSGDQEDNRLPLTLIDVPPGHMIFFRGSKAYLTLGERIRCSVTPFKVVLPFWNFFGDKKHHFTQGGGFNIRRKGLEKHGLGLGTLTCT